MGQWFTGVWGTGGMGHMSNGNRDNGVQGYMDTWGTWVMEYIGIIMLDLDLDVKI